MLWEFERFQYFSSETNILKSDFFFQKTGVRQMLRQIEWEYKMDLPQRTEFCK